jgi:hypothetical protein
VTSLAPYLTPEQREARLDELARRAGIEPEVLGTSVEGRPIRCVKLPCKRSPEAAVLLCGNIHGVELIASHTALAFLEALIDDRFPELRDRLDVFVLPCINVDGFARTWDQGGEGELIELRANAHGVDLNRNFPRPTDQPPSRIKFAGTDHPGTSFYRGTHPLSEPETAAVESLLAREKLLASISLHSFMGTVIPPRVLSEDDFEGYRRLAAALAKGQKKTRYWRLAHRTFDVFTGEMEDHQHHVHGTWAVCMEIFPLVSSFMQHAFAPSLFWRFNPRDPSRWYDNDLPGIAAYYRSALELGARGDRF